MSQKTIICASNNLSESFGGYEIEEAVVSVPSNPISTTTDTKLGVSNTNTKNLLIKFVETIRKHVELCNKKDCCCIQLKEVLQNGET